MTINIILKTIRYAQLEVRNGSFSTSCITLLQNCLLECDALFYFLGSTAPSEPRSPPCRAFTITLRHTTLDRTPLDERSTRRRDFYLTTHNTHKRQTSTPPAGFDPAILAGERPQTHALNRPASGIGRDTLYSYKFTKPLSWSSGQKIQRIASSQKLVHDSHLSSSDLKTTSGNVAVFFCLLVLRLPSS
jgi:hypothetical protein